MYKIVVADSRSPRNGRFIEAIGQYIPLKEPAEIVLNEERALYWLKNGAQPTDTVSNILSREGLLLHMHLIRKGKTEEQIAGELQQWRTAGAESRQRKLAKKQAARKKPAPVAEPAAASSPVPEQPAEQAE